MARISAFALPGLGNEARKEEESKLDAVKLQILLQNPELADDPQMKGLFGGDKGIQSLLGGLVGAKEVRRAKDDAHRLEQRLTTRKAEQDQDLQQSLEGLASKANMPFDAARATSDPRAYAAELGELGDFNEEEDAITALRRKLKVQDVEGLPAEERRAARARDVASESEAAAARGEGRRFDLAKELATFKEGLSDDTDGIKVDTAALRKNADRATDSFYTSTMDQYAKQVAQKKVLGDTPYEGLDPRVRNQVDLKVDRLLQGGDKFSTKRPSARQFIMDNAPDAAQFIAAVDREAQNVYSNAYSQAHQNLYPGVDPSDVPGYVPPDADPEVDPDVDGVPEEFSVEEYALSQVPDLNFMVTQVLQAADASGSPTIKQLAKEAVDNNTTREGLQVDLLKLQKELLKRHLKGQRQDVTPQRLLGDQNPAFGTGNRAADAPSQNTPGLF